VNGASGRQDVAIDFTGGAFAPGFGADTGTAEIEFQVKLALGSDSLTLTGGAAADNFRIGTTGINVNGDGDGDDITIDQVEGLSADGNAGADVIRADGGLGTGGIYTSPLFITGGDGNDTLTGGQADDGLYGHNNNDVLNGGDGSDELYGYAGADQLNGGADIDYLYPGLDNDVVNAGGGRDRMYATDAPPDGADVFNGGDGLDYISYYPRITNLTIKLDGLANDGAAGENDNVKADVEQVQGGQGADSITGSDANNTLDGYLGADTIRGGPGDDTVNGGSPHAAADILYGDYGVDSLTGYGGNDKLYGGADVDYLTGGLGNDLMDAGGGNDWLSADYNGLDGSDSLCGGPGFDAAYSYRSTGDQTFTIGDNTANDGLAGENDNIHSDVEEVDGGQGNDKLTGNAAANYLFGYGGNDVLDGKDGDDYLGGYDGNDTLTGGDGEDDLYGDIGADSFKALDGGFDRVYGGSDSDTDVVVNKDSFDSINQIP